MNLVFVIFLKTLFLFCSTDLSHTCRVALYFIEYMLCMNIPFDNLLVY